MSIQGWGRVTVAAIAGLAVGGATLFLAGAVFHPTQPVGTITFWGVVNGLAAGSVTLALSVALAGRGTSTGRVGMYALGALLLTVSALTFSWGQPWGVAVASAEALWLWPLAVGSGLGAVAAFRGARRDRR